MSQQTPMMPYSELRRGPITLTVWPWRSLIVWIALWLMAIGIFCAAMFGEEKSMMPGIFGIVILPAGPFLLAITFDVIFRRVRRARAVAVLAHLEHAVRMNLPLDAYLVAAVDGSGYFLAQRLMELRQAAASGCDAGVALGQAAPELPERTFGVIASAQKSGQLAEALREEVTRLRNRPESLLKHVMFARFYPFILLIFLSWVMLFLVIFIVPKFRDIFKDFRTTLPPMTEWLINGTSFATDNFGIVVFIGMLLLFIWLVGAPLTRLFGPRDKRFLPLKPIRQYIAWHLPLLHKLACDRGLADIFQVLSGALQARRPLPEAMGDLRILALNTVLARRVARIADDVERGEVLSVALRRAEFPYEAVGMLASAEMSGALPETCEFLARHYRTSFSRTAIVLQAAMEPALVILMGSIVGFVVVALFLPLMKLIDSFTGGVGMY